MIMKVSILGRDYNIKTEDDEEYVQKVSRYINEKAQNISKNTGVIATLDLAILTLLNIADDYFKLKENIAKDVDNKLQRLIDFIESADL